MGRRLSTGVLSVAVVALFAAGCGGGSSSNGEVGKPAGAVFSDAKTAALAATSVHVKGAIVDAGTSLALDLVLAERKAKGAMSENGLAFEIVRIDNAAYIKGGDKFLQRFAGAAAALLRGKWLKGPLASGDLAALAPLTDIAALFKGSFKRHGKLVNEGETTYHGQKVVAIRDASDGSVLYVAATGTPYPVGAKESGKSKGAITFDHWGDPVSISAPKDAVDLSKLGS